MLCTVMERGRSDFERFVVEVEPRVRRALVAGFGAVVGRAAAADALAWAWQNGERVREIERPATCTGSGRRWRYAASRRGC